MLNELKQQKAELLNWYVFTRDKAISKEMRKLDTKIKKLLQEKGQKL